LCLVTQVHTRMPLLEAVHYAQTNVTLLAEIQRTPCLLLQRTHTRHRRCIPLEGQCCEYFTSSRLSWDAVRLGLPLGMPLAVTISSCEWTINSRTRSSRTYLCAILPPHDLWTRNTFRMVISVRWKKVFWSTSMSCGQFHSC